MTQKISILILACVVVLISAVLSGCGSSSPTNANSVYTVTQNTGGGGGGGTYGSLTLSGTGTALTGTTYNALYVASASMLGTISAGWYNSNLATGVITYPLIIVNMQCDSLGNVSSIGMSYSPSVGNLTSIWGASSFMPGQISSTSVVVSTTARTITFNNQALPIASPASTMVLNGTLKY